MAFAATLVRLPVQSLNRYCPQERCGVHTAMLSTPIGALTIRQDIGRVLVRRGGSRAGDHFDKRRFRRCLRDGRPRFLIPRIFLGLSADWHLERRLTLPCLTTTPMGRQSHALFPLRLGRSPSMQGVRDGRRACISRPSVERCESGRIGLTANELIWETGSEGSNPSLSARRICS